GIRRGFKILQEDRKQSQDNFANIDTTWSALDCVIYTSTVEASISFEISGYFDAVIGITNIATSVYIEKLIRAELSVLRPEDLLTIIKGYLIASTGAILELILVENTEKINKNKISHTIKNTKKKLKRIYASDDINGFVTQEEIIAIKVNNSKYFSIGPILPLYKPELIDETQDFFDSMPITNNITSEYTKHEVSDLSNNEIDEKDLFLKMLAQYDTKYRKNSS
ncbi:8421_t:CDS:2, partial [Scutellospora calospora]